MKRILRVLRQSMAIAILVGLLGLSNLAIFASQPAYAANQSQQTIDNSQAAAEREESYEEAVEEALNPDKMDRAYEENVKEYKETQPDKGLIEGAKDLVEKVTGK